METRLACHAANGTSRWFTLLWVERMRQMEQRCGFCRTREDCIWLQVVAGAAALAGRMRKSAAEQLSDALAAGDSGGLGLRDIDRLLQVRIVVASAPVQRVVHASLYWAAQEPGLYMRACLALSACITWKPASPFCCRPLTGTSCSRFVVLLRIQVSALEHIFLGGAGTVDAQAGIGAAGGRVQPGAAAAVPAPLQVRPPAFPAQRSAASNPPWDGPAL